VSIIAKAALPNPSYVGRVDGTEVDQSAWRDGILVTRVLDPAVGPLELRLSWRGVSKATADAIRYHYDEYATGRDGGGRQFEFLPPGGTIGVDELVVRWIGVLSFSPSSARYYSVSGAVAVCVETDFGQAPTAGAFLKEDGDTLLLEDGDTLATEFHDTVSDTP
jgi:hypothetical protein